MKKLLSAAALTLGIAAAAPASAIVVGGIDFGTLGNSIHLETTTLAETFVNGTGQSLEGYGLISTVNGSSSYCAGGGSCSLYYHFTGYTSTFFNGTQVVFTGGNVNLYYSNASAFNLLSQNSLANIAMITALTPWVSLIGHTFNDPTYSENGTLNGTGSLTGGSLSATGAGQLDVVPDSGVDGVAAYLNGDGIDDGLGGVADIVMTTSANNIVLNPLDAAGPLADSCRTPNPQVGDWCFQGTLNTRGITEVPEPGTLMLLGAGLIGVVAAQRRRKHLS